MRETNHEAANMTHRSNRSTGRAPRPVRFAAVCAGLLVLGLGATGCVRAKAASVPQGPPLSVPAPPARVVIPVPEDEPRAEAPAPAAVPPDLPAPRPEAPRARPAPAETRTEPAVPAPAAPAAATEKPSLQIAPSAGESAASEKGVLAELARYADFSKRIDRSGLSSPQRMNLTEAISFERRARDYLANKNYQAALAAAEKAAQLAESLLK
jgi:hypothetical protein